MRSWESVRPPRFSAGGRDSHHSLRHDGRMAEKCEEAVYKTRVSIVTDRMERAERVALGLSTRVRTGQPWVKPGNDKEKGTRQGTRGNGALRVHGLKGAQTRRVTLSGARRRAVGVCGLNAQECSG
jgi:hypothetical protein